MIFMEEGPEKKNPLLVRKIRRFEWNSEKTIYRRIRNSGKRFYSLMKTNIMYLDEIGRNYVRRIAGELLGGGG